MNVTEKLNRIYQEAEQNVRVESFFDAGWFAMLGDIFNGWYYQSQGHFDTFPEAVDWLYEKVFLNEKNEEEGVMNSNVVDPFVEPMMQFFEYSHLPEHLGNVSKPFCELARTMVNILPRNNPETTACLRKLLEAKDCAVRAILYKKS